MNLLIAEIRQGKILEAISNNDVVFLKELAMQMGMSESTIRRDLLKLEQDGKIEALRGGAVRLKSRRLDPPTVENQKIRMDIKRIIAKKAAALVNDGDIIYIDAGTTTSAMVPFLAGKKITVVTPGLEVLQFFPVENVAVVAVGGEVNFELSSFCGPIAEKQLSNMYFDKAFLSISAYTDTGIFANDIREGRRKEIVKEHSSETYALGDRTKQQQWGFMQVMDRSECTLITETDEEVDALNKSAQSTSEENKLENDVP